VLRITKIDECYGCGVHIGDDVFGCSHQIYGTYYQFYISYTPDIACFLIKYIRVENYGNDGTKLCAVSNVLQHRDQKHARTVGEMAGFAAPCPRVIMKGLGRFGTEYS